MMQNEPAPAASFFHGGDFRALLRARTTLLRRIFLAIALPCVVAGALLPARFKARAVLTVLPAPEFTVRQDAGSRNFSAAMLALDQIMKSETAILESDALHAATLRAMGLAAIYPDIAQETAPGIAMRTLGGLWQFLSSPWLGNAKLDPGDRALVKFSRHVNVVPAKDSNVIEVSFTHADARIAAVALNAMLAEYARDRSSLYHDPQLAVVRAQLAQLANAADAAQRAESAFKARMGISNLQAQRDLALRRQDELRASEAAAEAEAAAQSARLATLQKTQTTTPSPATLYQERDATQVQALDGAILDLRGKLATAREHYRDTSRHVRDLQTELRARESERGTALHDPTIAAHRAGRTLAQDNLDMALASAAADLASAHARAAQLKLALTAVAAELRGLDGLEVQLAGLERARVAAADAYASTAHVLAEQGLTEAEDALRLANVRLVQPATPPLSPMPWKILLALGGVFAGAAAGIGVVLVEYARRPLLFTADGVAQLCGLPVLGIFELGETQAAQPPG